MNNISGQHANVCWQVAKTDQWSNIDCPGQCCQGETYMLSKWHRAKIKGRSEPCIFTTEFFQSEGLTTSKADLLFMRCNGTDDALVEVIKFVIIESVMFSACVCACSCMRSCIHVLFYSEIHSYTQLPNFNFYHREAVFLYLLYLYSRNMDFMTLFQLVK